MATHAANSYMKPLIKIIARGTLLGRAITPLPQTTLAFTCWIQSVAYNVACIFQATQAFLWQAQVVYSKLVLKRPWIAAEHAHLVLRSLKIARGPAIEQAMITSFIGFALRRYDGAHLLGLTEGGTTSLLGTVCFAPLKTSSRTFFRIFGNA